jgi:hypothetical protein
MSYFYKNASSMLGSRHKYGEFLAIS